MTSIYARDLKPEFQTDTFMGKGFEEKLAKARKNGNDMKLTKEVRSWN